MPPAARSIAWCFVVLLFGRMTLSATEQFPDIMFVGSSTKVVCEIWPGEIFQKRLERWKKKRGYVLENTANRKGYIAEWKLEEAQLYLMSIKVETFDARKREVTVPFQYLFKRDGPLKADFVSGEVIELLGPLIPFIPSYKTERVHLFEKGILKKSYRRKAKW